MSEHVKRAGRDYTVFYILLIGLLLILVGKFFDFYKLPRTAYVETTPKAARISSGDIFSYGCQHEDLIEPAKRAFKNRLYLPALIKGTAVNKVIKAEIVYGSDGGGLPQNPAIKYKRELEHRTLDNNVLEGQTSKKTINKDAQIISCPRFKTPSSLKRSGHCIFEFDLTDKGRISQMRQIKCTDAALKAVTLSSLKKCKFSPALTDGVAVNRVYMKHQIDANVYNRNGQKIPIHSSFGTNSLEKPYKIYK